METFELKKEFDNKIFKSVSKLTRDKYGLKVRSSDFEFVETSDYIYSNDEDLIYTIEVISTKRIKSNKLLKLEAIYNITKDELRIRTPNERLNPKYCEKNYLKGRCNL